MGGMIHRAMHYLSLVGQTQNLLITPRAPLRLQYRDLRGGGTYVRAQVLRAAFILRPNSRDPANRTEFTHVLQLNLGGVMSTWLGAKVANRMYAGAANVVPALEAAAKKSTQTTTRMRHRRNVPVKAVTPPHVAGVQVT